MPMEFIPMDADEIAVLEANQRSRGQFVTILSDFMNADVSNAPIPLLNGTTIENNASGFKRAADKLKVNVTVLKDKDNERIVLVKHEVPEN